MTVWQISDGDGSAIGGNHFIHAVPPTSTSTHHPSSSTKSTASPKGQYSPPRPAVSGVEVEPLAPSKTPFIPAELVFGARGNFFARSIDVELATSQEVLAAAARHKEHIGGLDSPKLA